MPYDDLVRAATAAVVFAVLYAGHMVGDHWTQTQHQSTCKALGVGGRSVWVAHWNCAKHVVTYTATQVVLLALAGWWLNLPLRPWWVVAGLAVSAVTHYVADLRVPLRWICERVGRIGFYRLAGNGLNGAYLLDQSWHIGWLAVAALLIAGP
ncbi:MAG TPA: transcriptional regulator [Actinoplanes sp.]